MTTHSTSSTTTQRERRTPMHALYELPTPEASPAAVRRPAPRCADGNGTLTPLFFSDDIIDIARAKAICAKCELSASCLSGAMDREEPWGVWGGELLQNGRIVRNKRPCGRPPKHPRPELIVDELGVVGSVA
jgi:Transcription factor WhiB